MLFTVCTITPKMMFCILFMLFTLYKCTTGVNQHELTRNNTRQLQPRELKRTYSGNTDANDSKRIKIAGENIGKDSLETFSAENDGKSIDSYAYFKNSHPEEPDVRDLAESLYTHNVPDQRCNMEEGQLLTEKIHVPDSTMASDNTLDDLILKICGPFDTDIQKMTAELESINDHYIEAHICNSQEHQPKSSQKQTSVQHNYSVAKTTTENANPNLQCIDQAESSISTVNCNKNAYQYTNMPANLTYCFDVDKADNELAKKQNPLPLNTIACQNAVDFIKAESSGMHLFTNVNYIQNDEKMTCPATLTLSFLSFRLFEINDSSSTHQNIDVNGVDSDEIDGAPEPSCKEQQQNSSQFVYSCKINLDENEINLDITGLTRNQLYAIANDRQNGDKTTYTFAETDVYFTMFVQNSLKFLEAIDVSRYSCLNMQELYLTVIAYKCLEYNHNLKCYVLKDFLRWIHIYMSEFYFYVMLRLEKLDQGDIEAAKNIDEYKKYMKDEIRYIVTIIAIYTDIDQLDPKAKLTCTMVGSIYYEVEQFRKHIFKFLKSYHSTDIATSLYYLAIGMRNKRLLSKFEPRYKDIEHPQGKKSQVRNHKKMVIVSKGEQHRKIVNKKTWYTYYAKFHCANMPKSMVYILAFTLSSARNKIFTYDLKTVKKIRFERKKALEPAIIVYRYVLNVANSETLKDAVCTTIRFLVFLMHPHYESVDIYNNLINELNSELLTITPKKFKNRRKLMHNHKLVLFNYYIQRAMCI